MKSILRIKSLPVAIAMAAVGIAIAAYCLSGVIGRSYDLDAANNPTSRRRPVVGQKTRTYNEIVQDVKMNADQAEKFLMIYTKYKDAFVAARRRGDFSDKDEAVYLQKACDGVIADSKSFLSDEQYEELKKKLGS